MSHIVVHQKDPSDNYPEGPVNEDFNAGITADV